VAVPTVAPMVARAVAVPTAGRTAAPDY
jgi:hypothetical protein